jgi:hypothetical protein
MSKSLAEPLSYFPEKRLHKQCDKYNKSGAGRGLAVEYLPTDLGCWICGFLEVAQIGYGRSQVCCLPNPATSEVAKETSTRDKCDSDRRQGPVEYSDCTVHWLQEM